MITHSLRGRLTLFLTLLVTITWLIGAAFSVRSTTKVLDQVFDNDLRQTAQRLLGVFDHELFGGNVASDLLDLFDGDFRMNRDYQDQDGVSISGFSGWEDNVNYIVVTRNRNVLFHSENADIETFPVVDDTGFYENSDYRFYYLTDRFGRIGVYLQEPLSYRRNVIREAYLEQIAPLIFIVPLTIIGIWLIVSFSMRPVSRFKDEIEQRGEGNLEPIESEGLPLEIASINASVNLLLARLRATLDVERRFISQAAHELRTPVAAAMAQTERLIKETKNKTELDRADNIRTSLKRLHRLCEKLLQLAKAEGGMGSRSTKFDLRDILNLLVDEFETSGQGKDRIDLNLPENAIMVNFDLDAYAIMARNLIENALVHGQGEISVRLEENGNLIVENSAPALSEQELENLQSPARELQPSIKGHGMGLLITQKIAEASHLSLRLASPIPGQDQGFQAVLGE